MAGAFALILAAFGSAVLSGTTDTNTLTADKYQTISKNYTGSANTSGGDVDVSRDFDRSLVRKQATDQARQREIALKQLAQKVEGRSDELEKNQWVVPVTGYQLTARFGQRSSLWSSGMHTGLDFAGPAGTTIVSIAAGTVKQSGYAGAYGIRTIVTLTDGTDVWYCHQSSTTVKVGDQVGPSDVIGYTGSTGNVTGPHLHLEIHPGGGAEGNAIDPYAALLAHGVRP
ncbi:MAG: hypothetical protein JWP31_692 [Aeromicrobium sp.]|nr:hypothetical protein [Aeromicrobium sp.]